MSPSPGIRRRARRQRAWRLVLVTLLATAVVATTAAWAVWPRENTRHAGAKVTVVATTNFLTDTVRRVGGDAVQVSALMGPGVDPHLYKPTSGDLERLRRADLVVAGGLHLEGKMEEVFTALGRSTHVLQAGDSLPDDRLLAPPGGAAAGEHDPHIWFDVRLWSDVVLGVEKSLSAVDPAHAAGYQARADGYLRELSGLDREIRHRMATIPAEQRVLVTSHDAFRYFGRAYDVDVVAIQGISTAAEATTADIDRVAQVIADRGVRSVFVESSVSPRTLEAVLAGARDRGAKVRIGGQLYADAAGPAGTPEGTYAGMLRANVDRLVEGLR